MTSPATPADASLALDAEIEVVLHHGVLSGHLSAVQALRRSLEVSRGLSQLGVVAGPSPATPSEPCDQHAARQPRPRYSKLRCPHSHPEKGPCVREPHPGAPRAHGYTRTVTRTTRTSAPTSFDAHPSVA